MKKLYLFVTAALMVIMFSFNVFAEETRTEVVISGYEMGQTAISGNVQKQIDKMVADIQATRRPIISFGIEGSADSTGSGNDSRSLERAKQVEGYLTPKFVGAKFGPYSKGAELNVRQVRIVYTLGDIPQVPATPMSQKEPEVSGVSIMELSLYFLVVVVSLIVIVVVAVHFFGRDKKKSEKRDEQNTDKVAKKAKSAEEKQVVTPIIFNTDGEAVIAITEGVNPADPNRRVFFTPYCHILANGSLGDLMFEKSFGDAKRSATKCYKSDKYRTQTEELENKAKNK